MEKGVQNQKWIVLTQSVTGAKHIQTALPNQDAVDNHFIEADANEPIIVAISDGHGSDKYFRSHFGSQIAVKVGIKALRELYDAFVPNWQLNEHSNPEFEIETITNTNGRNENSSNFDAFSLFKNNAEHKLPKEITKLWREEVERHVEVNAIGNEEIEELKRRNINATDLSTEDLIKAYGATLLLSCVSRHFLLFLQIGDGDILTISEDGIVQSPLPIDPKLFSNETTSLCSSNAWNDFRVIVRRAESDIPDLIFLSTDGYSNSYSNDEDFKTVSKDLLNYLIVEGHEYVSRNLKLWLDDTTANGSGDDITIGIIWKQPLLKADVESLKETVGNQFDN